MSVKGIIDPWAPPKKVIERAPRINLEEVDMDADLRVAQSYVFRSVHGSINVANTKIGTPEDALRDLALCLLKLSTIPRWGAAMVTVGIGMQFEKKLFNMPISDEPCSEMRTRDGYKTPTRICFIQQDKEQGMLQLVKMLRDVRRSPQQKVLQEFGVIPMLR